MKSGEKYTEINRASRTPHGVRGLKSPEEQTPSYLNQVAPHTGCVD